MDLDIPRNLAAAVFPTKVYIIYESDGAPSALNFGDAIGSTGKVADLLAADYLVKRGEWNGRRPLVWLNDVRISELAAEYHAIREVEPAELARQLMVAATIHELAHVAEQGVDTAPISNTRKEFAVAIAAYSAETLHSPERPPFDCHGWRWIRNSIHLHHRALQAGYETPLDLVMIHENYCLPPLEQFASRLHGQFEPSNLARESIFDINTFRPPHLFAELWKDSVRYWLAQQTAYTPAIHPAIDMLNVVPDEVKDVRVT